MDVCKRSEQVVLPSFPEIFCSSSKSGFPVAKGCGLWGKIQDSRFSSLEVPSRDPKCQKIDFNPWSKMATGYANIKSFLSSDLEKTQYTI